MEECRAINPDVIFLLENVRMKKEWEDVISRILGIQPILINSALLSAQNRERLYWTNLSNEKRGLFDDAYCSIPQPKDKGIYLKDVLQSNVAEKYYLSNIAIARILRKGYSQPQINHEKTGTLNTKNNSGQLSIDSGTTLIISDRGTSGAYIVTENKTGALSARDGGSHDHFIINSNDLPYLKIGKNGERKENQEKASCFTAGGNSGGNHSDMDYLIIHENPVVHNLMPRSGDPTKGGTGHLSWKDGKTYCLDTGNTNAVEVRNDSLTPIFLCTLQTIISIFTSKFKDEKRNNKRNAYKALCILLEKIGEAKDGQWEVGSTYTLQQKEILREIMHGRGFQKENLLGIVDGYACTGEEIDSKEGVRKMPFKEEFRYTSQGRELEEQLYGKFASFMQVVSQLGSQPSKNMYNMWNETEGAWLLRKALPTLQKIWEPLDGKGKSTLRGKRIRRLTVVECSRLQTVPDDYFFHEGQPIVSETQMYRMLGNGWTISVIEYIFSFLPTR